ncbi:MAG: hypothetical protein WCE90_01910 [Candidatus Zixiibacteriota bacterium]
MVECSRLTGVRSIENPAWAVMELLITQLIRLLGFDSKTSERISLEEKSNEQRVQ